MSETQYPYLECLLRDAMGISDGLIKKTRKRLLKDRRDYALIEKRIAYTEDAARKVIEHLSGPAVSAATAQKVSTVDVPELLSASLREPIPPEKQANPEDVPTLEKQTEQLLLQEPWKVPDCEMIFHKKPLNQRILLGRIPQDWINKHGQHLYLLHGIDARKPQRIRVKDNANFTEGMKIPCSWIQNNLWQCTKRMPRGRGKW